MPPRRKKDVGEAEGTGSASTTRGKRTSARQKDALAKAEMRVLIIFVFCGPPFLSFQHASNAIYRETVSEALEKKRKSTSDNQENFRVNFSSRTPLTSSNFHLEKKTRKRVKGTSPTAADVKNDDGADVVASTGKNKAARKTKGVVTDESVKSPEELFDAYADANDTQAMGAEGLERLCKDANIPMDRARPLLLAWQLDAKELATFSREEWTKGLSELQISSLESLATALLDLEDLIVLRKPPPRKPAAQSISKGIKSRSTQPAIDRYKKDRYWSYAEDVDSVFSQFYNFCFALVKKEGSRNIDMEFACAFWSVILAPTHPVMLEVIEFITEKGTYKGVNKDLWTMMYEFCQTVEPSLESYDSEGAWPTLLDDFVAWKKAKTDASAAETSV